MTESFSKHPTLKWMVQNAQSVMIRNLAPERMVQSALPSTRLELCTDTDGKMITLYKSNVTSQSLNPTWTMSGLVPSAAQKDYLNIKNIIVRAVCTNADKSESVIFSEEVNLTQLVPFKQPVLNGKFSIPINLLLINIDDALYTTERSFNIFFARTAKYTGDVFVLDEETDPDTLATTSALSEGIAASQIHIEVLRKGLTTTLQKTDLVRLQTKKNDRQAELEKLRAEVAAAEAELTQNTIAFAEEKRIFAAGRKAEMMESTAACQELLTLQQSARVTINNKKQDWLKIKFLLEARKIKLLSELQTIYPIERLDNGEFAIRGVEMPADLYAREDEQVAAALGYTVHLLLLASKYLEIPLRYQLLFMASRSFIRDPVVGNGTTLPLFRRGTERERFDRAVLW
eukprot:CAMPEP_0184971788 /NCGR_PEP_ID=MMETSP1098-20130426/3964_1 /TAXON_ID=89044 /ORGANISM="Spumella elongata, Strain CCAP 955/1" /LENGTH=400 /DNA_ID=CAMNT_0027493981 /DNA_START=63 /DNA_END=1262 /DNA_ORIENTATION=+